MNKALISVIIPVYNAEKYIDKCLQSIVKQTFENNIEILVVNDGSTDNTTEILEKLSKKIPNLRVFHIENGGVSNARNIGISKAVGEYITFVDADDWLELNCYEEMYKEAVKSGADIVAAGIYIDDEHSSVTTRELCESNVCIDGKTAVRNYLYGTVDVHVWNKLIKRSIASKHCFDSTIKIGEDKLYTFECLVDAQKVFLMSNCYYHYVLNETSAVHQKFSEKNLHDIAVSNRILEITGSKYEDLIPYAECMFVNVECRLLSDIVCNSLFDEYKEVYEFTKRDVRKFSVIKCARFSSRKHFIGLVIAKINPRLFGYLRGNNKIKYRK